MSHFASSTFRLLLLILGTAPVAQAQCANPWRVGPSGDPAIAPDLTTIGAWDPDGPGPESAKLVVGGAFTFAGDPVVGGVATWNHEALRWTLLAAGSDGEIAATFGLPDGSLLVGGSFTQIDGIAAHRIARWDGQTWSALGAGLDGTVRAIGALPNGDIVAGGDFLHAGLVPVGNVARWDGAAWSPVGGGVFGSVLSLHCTASGDIVVAGTFSAAGGGTHSVARWNGSAWSLASGTPPGMVGAPQSAAVSPAGVAAIGCRVLGPSPEGRVFTWDGAAWQDVTPTCMENVYCVAFRPDGTLTAGGSSGSCGAGGAFLAGYGWVIGPSGRGYVHDVVVLPDGNAFVFGEFGELWGNSILRTENFAQWSPSHGWVPVAGVEATVRSLADLHDDGIVVGGVFEAIGGRRHARIARWDDGAWWSFGSGFPSAYPASAHGVLSLAVSGAGDLFALHAGLASLGSGIVRWDGSNWLGQWLPWLGAPNAITTAQNGDVLAAGLAVGRWSGGVWTMLGGAADQPVRSVVGASSGVVYAAGEFATIGGTAAARIARWDGVTWAPLGAGVGGTVRCLAELPDGSLVAGGAFTSAGMQAASNLARWDGANWNPLGSGTDGDVLTLAVLPNGDLVAGGSFSTAGGSPSANLARWNGTTWAPIGAGTNGAVHALLMRPAGELWVAGDFTRIDGMPAGHLAVLETTCGAGVATFGSGCGALGTHQLAAPNLPWVDTVFRATGTGLPTVAAVLAATSFHASQPGFPLAAVFPEALIGCDLFVAPDLVELLLTTNGSVTSQLPLPNTPPLVGSTFYHQMVAFELTGSLGVAAVTTTNALQLTAGTF